MIFLSFWAFASKFLYPSYPYESIEVRFFIHKVILETKIEGSWLEWTWVVILSFNHFLTKKIKNLILIHSNGVLGWRCSKGSGRPKLTLEFVVRKDLGFQNIIEHNALDRAQWEKWIHVAYPNWSGLKALFRLVCLPPYGNMKSCR